MISVNKTNIHQNTIKETIEIKGIGLHTGCAVNIRLEKASIDNGIKFIRIDKYKHNVIEAIWSNVTATNLSTTISNSHTSVSTIEHLMSALSGMHIDNANILIDNVEVPIMDGSSLPFVKELENIGVIEQHLDRKILVVKKEVKVSKGDSYVKITPNSFFSINFEIDFESNLINKQAKKLQLINGNYRSDISSARTFGFEKDVDNLRSAGLALGGSLENAVVVGEKNILNKEGLRFDDEFVRHNVQYRVIFMEVNHDTF